MRTAPASDRAKRLFDLAIGLPLALAALPLLVLLGLLVRIDSPGPAIFRQTRVGRGGVPFTCYKLRTMAYGADPEPHQRYVRDLIRGSPTTHRDPRGDTLLKLTNDPRVTRLGRFLRRASVDELPQLLNVLRGDMSLVGPRPSLPYEVEQYEPWHHRRLDGLPGIAGLWQVVGRSTISFDEMVRLDIEYLERRSLWLDAKLLWRAAWAALSGRGAV